jgi:hypothetical protein
MAAGGGGELPVEPIHSAQEQEAGHVLLLQECLLKLAGAGRQQASGGSSRELIKTKVVEKKLVNITAIKKVRRR